MLLLPSPGDPAAEVLQASASSRVRELVCGIQTKEKPPSSLVVAHVLSQDAAERLLRDASSGAILLHTAHAKSVADLHVSFRLGALIRSQVLAQGSLRISSGVLDDNGPSHCLLLPSTRYAHIESFIAFVPDLHQLLVDLIRHPDFIDLEYDSSSRSAQAANAPLFFLHRGAAPALVRFVPTDAAHAEQQITLQVDWKAFRLMLHLPLSGGKASPQTVTTLALAIRAVQGHLGLHSEPAGGPALPVGPQGAQFDPLGQGAPLQHGASAGAGSAESARQPPKPAVVLALLRSTQHVQRHKGVLHLVEGCAGGLDSVPLQAEWAAVSASCVEALVRAVADGLGRQGPPEVGGGGGGDGGGGVGGSAPLLQGLASSCALLVRVSPGLAAPRFVGAALAALRSGKAEQIGLYELLAGVAAAVPEVRTALVNVDGTDLLLELYAHFTERLHQEFPHAAAPSSTTQRVPSSAPMATAGGPSMTPINTTLVGYKGLGEDYVTPIKRTSSAVPPVQGRPIAPVMALPMVGADTALAPDLGGTGVSPGESASMLPGPLGHPGGGGGAEGAASEESSRAPFFAPIPGLQPGTPVAEAAPSRSAAGGGSGSRQRERDDVAAAGGAVGGNQRTSKDSAREGSVSSLTTDDLQLDDELEPQTPSTPKMVGLNLSRLGEGGAEAGGVTPDEAAATSVGVKKILIPRLTLPQVAPAGMQLGGLTRSTRRSSATDRGELSSTARHNSSSTRGRRSMLAAEPSTETSMWSVSGAAADRFAASARAEMALVGKEIGQIHLLADLTAVIAHKRYAPNLTRNRGDGHSKDEAAGGAIVLSPRVEASVPYRIKCALLELFLHLAPQVGATATGAASTTVVTGRSPVNHLAAELASGGYRRSPIAAPGSALRRRALDVLLKYANVVAVPVTLTAALTMEGRGGGGVGVGHADALLRRVCSRLATLLAGKRTEAPALEELEVQLTLLAEYVEGLDTAGVVHRVVEVIGESLVQVKHLLLSFGRFGAWRPATLPLMGALLRLADALTSKSGDGLVGELLLAMLVEGQSGLQWVREYAKHVLFSQSLASELPAATLSALRIGVIRHLRIMVTTVAHSKRPGEAHAGVGEGGRLPEWARDPGSERNPERGGGGPTLVDTQKELMRFHFMMDPSKGYCMRVLGKSEPGGALAGSPGLRQEVLLFIHTVLALPSCPYLQHKRLVDDYIRYHFLAFVKLYVPARAAAAAQTQECTTHLQVLLTISLHKTEAVVRRFHQLRIMDFLIREIDLEFEASPFITAPPRPPPEYASPQGVGKNGSPLASPLRTPGASARASSRLGASPSARGGAQPGGGGPRGTAGGGLGSSRKGGGLGLPGLRLPGVLPKPEGGDGGEAAKPSPVPRLSLGGTGGKMGLAPSRVLPKAERGEQKGEVAEAQPAGRIGAVEFTGDLEEDVDALEAEEEAEAERRRAEGKESNSSRGSSSSSSDDDDDEPGAAREYNTGAGAAPGAGAAAAEKEVPPSLRGEKHFTGDLNEDIDLLTSSSSDDDSEPGGGDDSDGEPLMRVVFRPPANKEPPPEPAHSAATPKPAPAIPGLSLGSVVPRQKPEPVAAPAASTPTAAAVPRPAAPAMSIPKLHLGPALTAQRGGSYNEQPEESTRPQSPDVNAPAMSATSAGLSAMEESLEAGRPKFQLVLGERRAALAHAMGSAGGAGALGGAHTPERAPANPEHFYHKGRRQRRLYQDKDLHLLVLEMVLSLMLAPSDGELEPLYCDQFPIEKRKHNIPFLLYLHVNHPANAGIIPELLARAQAQGSGAVRMLKLTCKALFQPNLYKQDHRERMARGAYAQVFRCKVPALGPMSPESVALKLVDLPQSIHDQCMAYDLFGEIGLLESLKGEPGMCQLRDYGVDDECFYLVLQDYKCSLRAWREQHQHFPLEESLPLYFNIYQQVLDCFQRLSDSGVVHYDIKCDNVLLQPAPDVDDMEFWDPEDDTPPFTVVIADFGESRRYSSAERAWTARNRGTEYIKSPEMLMVSNATKKTRSTFDRRKRQGAGRPSDVWSIGCLLYELVAGDFLFYDPDWIRFFVRVTQQGQELLPRERVEAVKGAEVALDFIQYTLVRDPLRRPTLDDLSRRFRQVREGFFDCGEVPSVYIASVGDLDTRAAANADAAPWERLMLRESQCTSDDPSSSPALKLLPEHVSLPQELRASSIFYERRPTPITEQLWLGQPGALCAVHAAVSAAATAGAFPSEPFTHVVLCMPMDRRLEVLLEDGRKGEAGTSEAQALQSCRRAGLETMVLRLKGDVKQEARRGGGGDGGERSDGGLAECLPQFLHFVWQSAGRPEARVLVAAPHALQRCAGALCMAHLMAERAMSVYEALLEVSGRRLGASPSVPQLQCLQAWEDSLITARQDLRGYTQLSCVCGRWRVALLRPLDAVQDRNPRPCSCSPGEASSCPSFSCAALLDALANRHGYVSDFVWWAYSREQDLAYDPLSAKVRRVESSPMSPKSMAEEKVLNGRVPSRELLARGSVKSEELTDTRARGRALSKKQKEEEKE
ncbi:hypothetical protein CYMTET_42796 [Cymbomonas tetramitiformis]|uniref:Protein kinase domain-containing protein n=1 Tax=Cymbomonas tetramitiformis TaxID=36881 RepID=A0AAE0C3C6_9CHLO|nr:hypothetical protein CYMTET_42796 [Cymbomonas tetramitiformis]